MVISNDDKFRHYLMEVYGSGKFTAEAITQWTEKPVADQTYQNARTYYEAKERAMETVQRLTAGRVGGAGYGTAAAALELKELRGAIKEAIEETIAQALEEKLAAHDHQGSEESANAMRQLKDDNAAQKNEMRELSRTVLALTAEVKALKDANKALEKRARGSSDEGAAPADSPPPKRPKKQHVWTPGLKYDPTWPAGKKRWYGLAFKKNEPKRYYKEQIERFQKESEKLSE